MKLFKSISFIPVLFVCTGLYWFIFYLIISFYFNFISSSIWKIFGLMPVSLMIMAFSLAGYFIITAKIFQLVQYKFVVYVVSGLYSIYLLYYLVQYNIDLTNSLQNFAEDISMPFWLYTFFTVLQIILVVFIAYERKKELDISNTRQNNF